MLGWGYSMRVIIKIMLMTWLIPVALAEGMVDPTKPPAAVMEYFPNAQTQLEKPWQVSAIQENGSAGFAVVNGEMVQVGSRYEGFKLTSVKHQQAVFISKTGEKKVLSMGLTRFIEQTAPAAEVNKTKSGQTPKKHKVKK